MTVIKAIHRQRLLKSGISAHNFKRISNPLENNFKFTSHNMDVRVESVKNVLPPHLYDIVKDALNRGKIMENNCHYNSTLVADLLRKYEVNVVQGYYVEKGDITQRRIAHSFLEYKGRYFDVTVELASDCYSIDDFAYHSYRLFDAYEMKVICCALGYLEMNDFSYKIFTTLSDDAEITTSELKYSGYTQTYILKDTGYLELFRIDNDYSTKIPA